MRMNTLVLAALALIPLLPVAAKAEDAPKASDSEKIDSLLVMQKQVVRTIKNDPLEGKTFGVEANIARLLLAGNVLSFSGGFSLFGVDRNAEIAFPFYYGRSETEDFDNENTLSNIDFTEITQDIHYRYFLGNTQNGFYLSAFARGAYLDGVLGEWAFDNIGDTTGAAKDSRDTETKLGLGVGLGYRFFSYKGLYWGTSLNIGRYVLGESDRFRGAFLSLDADEEVIIDVELLKFGWAF
jgi:hypothetical protein